MNRRFQQNPKVEAATLNDEVILFEPTAVKFFLLNPTSTFVWNSLSTPTALEPLAEAVCTHFDDVALGDALRDVRATLDEMVAMSLVVTADAG